MKNLSLSIGDNKIEIGSGRKIDLLHILAIIHYIVKTGNGRCGAFDGQSGPEWSQNLRVALALLWQAEIKP